MPCDRRLLFPRAIRLRRRAQFVAVYGDGLRATGRYMVVFARPRSGEWAENRLGVTASRRVGNAVVRNRCKRRLRELLRTAPEEHRGLQADVVINARPGCERADWSELEQDYRRCMRRLRVKLNAARATRDQ